MIKITLDKKSIEVLDYLLAMHYASECPIATIAIVHKSEPLPTVIETCLTLEKLGLIETYTRTDDEFVNIGIALVDEVFWG